MSQGKFISRFLEAQRAKGNDLGPLFGTLERLASDEKNAAPAPAPASLVAPEEPAPPGVPRPLRTVQDFAREIEQRRPVSRQDAPAAPRVAYRFNPSESLTACLDSAECPRTARTLFRLLHELGLESIRKRGLPVRPDIAVFHLPLELLAAHLQVDRVTVWRNLQPLKEAGLLDERDHYGTLRGQTAVTGKLWAVSTAPELVLSGQSRRVRLTHTDLKARWRDLERDVKVGRTAYELTRSEAQKQADKARREAQAGEQAAARARADQRKAEREAARARGEKPLTGRAAATANAKETKAQKPRPSRTKSELQQSLEGLKAVSKAQLQNWVLAPFSDLSDVTLTVANGAAIRPLSGLDTVYSLSLLPSLTKQERNAAVEAAARSLAAAFGDSDNLRFWCWLLWQLIRGCDQGQNWTDDVAHLLARVLHDLRHDESMNDCTVKNPAAVVVNELRKCGLLDALRALAPTRAGGRPRSPEPAPLFA